MKRARKVALINVFDYPREDYSAYWAVEVHGADADGYRWAARLFSYDPVGWEWQGKVTAERPADLPLPQYPSDAHLARQDDYVKMTPIARLEERRRQDAFRAACAAVYEANPKPQYLLDEALDVAPTRDEADTAAQNWVLERICKYRRADAKPLSDVMVAAMVEMFDEARRKGEYGKADRLRGRLKSAGVLVTPPTSARDPKPSKFKRQGGHTLLLGPLDMLAGIGARVWDFVLMAIAYAVAIRNNQMNQVRDAIDAGAGAGLWRIYDGSRPATCGTATTLGAELTCSDPCAAGAASGVMTFSAITADASANATITATWSRLVDSTGTCAVDGNVGTSGSDLNMNSVAIGVGQQVSITSATITAGNA